MTLISVKLCTHQDFGHSGSSAMNQQLVVKTVVKVLAPNSTAESGFNIKYLSQ